LQPIIPPTFLLKITQNTGILLLVNLSGAGLGLLLAAALGRGLGDAGFGQYSLVMTWLLSLLLLAEFGLSTVLTRDLAARPQQTPGYLINSIVAKMGLGLLLSAGLWLAAPWLALQQNPAEVAALRWGGLYLLTGLVYSSFTAVFRARQIMTPILWLTLGGQSALLAGTVALLLTRQPLWTLIAWGGISQGLQAWAAARLAARRGVAGPLRRAEVDLRLARALLDRAWPFALAGLLAALQMRANIFLLGYMQGDQALGWFAAANRFMDTGRQLPGAFYAAIFPAMARLSTTNPAALQKTFNQARLWLLAFGLAAAAAALPLANPVLKLVYGPAFTPATAALQLLALSITANSQNSLLIIYLYARGREKTVNWLTAAGLAVNLVLCAWLIPHWGAAGAAMALLAAETILYFLYYQQTLKIKSL
jgi:O-antigen/teichoic acid export membrane protein